MMDFWGFPTTYWERVILVSCSSVNRVSKPQYLREYSLSFHFCAILPILNANVFHHEANFWNGLLHYHSGEVFDLRAKTWRIHEFNKVILLTKVFGLMVWFLCWVGEVPSWILEMPNFTNFDKRCLNSVFKTWLVYKFKYCYIIDKGIWSIGMILALGARGPEFNSWNASFHSPQKTCVSSILKTWFLYVFEHG